MNYKYKLIKTAKLIKIIINLINQKNTNKITNRYMNVIKGVVENLQKYLYKI